MAFKKTFPGVLRSNLVPRKIVTEVIKLSNKDNYP